ncbi:Golgi resident protein GCP60 [Phlebotomus argentipes]|uniref:Golgi resident protein GCP60 n=1 Tax=Phlebotomus argentipes TaxID=94469 RepID=UPI0028929EB7|nr:Golgi resident protein GCP60 [Phlebotomus argentipes]
MGDSMENVAIEGEKWGFPLKDIYRLALKFYKEKLGKAVYISYEDNLKLVAFTQQATHGALDPDKTPPIGVLDVIGRDRRVAWQQLGDIGRGQAMQGFIDLLDRLCPTFKPYAEAIRKDKEEKVRQAEHDQQLEKERQVLEQLQLEEQKRIDDEKNRAEQQKRQLQNVLNQQTFHQFKAYADKQFPGNPDQQAHLIRQLQNEHYHQYMQQLQAQVVPGENGGHSKTGSTENLLESAELAAEAEESLCQSDNEESSEYPVISRASMWTRSDLKAFKQEVSAGSGDGVIRVGHGDTVTVRVPTHEGGSCLFWEFATDNYDIGFGVYFEWGKSPTSEVSVHISESDDEDELGEDEEDLDSSDMATVDDLESGPLQTIVPSSLQNKPPISIIVPIYRRDCQNEVYAGSHVYPGEGVYLLKFDNSYSLWRSKTLYYRVFYTR